MELYDEAPEDLGMPGTKRYEKWHKFPLESYRKPPCSNYRDVPNKSRTCMQLAHMFGCIPGKAEPWKAENPRTHHGRVIDD